MHDLRHLLLLPVLALAGLACGSGVQLGTTGAGGAGTSSSSTTATTGAGSGGMGGATASASTAASSGSGGQGTGGQTTGGANPPPCVGTLGVGIDNKALQVFAFECAGDVDASDWATPVGYQFSGNLPGSPQGLRVVACKSAAAGSEGVVLSAYGANATGTYTTGLAQYTDPNGMMWGAAGDPFNMVVTKLGPGGQPIEGTFSVTATSNNTAQHTLTGSFHVCHGADFLPP